jgi:hypothetical protein
MRLASPTRQLLWLGLGIGLAGWLAFPATSIAQPYRTQVVHNPDVSTATSVHDCNDPLSPLGNCGFETGDFTDWVPMDIVDAFWPLSVDGAGVEVWEGFFVSQPTEGVFAALNGFDGCGPGDIILAQDVNLPAGTMNIDFDYRGDLLNFGAQHPFDDLDRRSRGLSPSLAQRGRY